MRRSWVLVTSVAAILAVAGASVADRLNINIGVEDNGDVDIIVEVPTECPKVDPKNTTVHLPHETDCTKFYRCEHGKRIILECHVSEVNGTRMHYNRIQQVCDWPERAGCVIGDNTTRQAITTEITTPRLPTALPMGSTTKLVSPKPYTENITTVTIESTTRDNGVPKKCPTVDSMDTTVHLPHETDCTKFYICDHGKPILSECPLMDGEGNRLHFNPVLQVCDWPNHAGCISTRTTTTEGELSSETTPMITVPMVEVDQNSTPTPADTYVPHENNCSRFYEIVNNEKILKECPRGLHFSPTEKHCDWPERADCELTTLTFTETTPNPESEGSCGNIGNNWVIAHECACNKYYTCSNGELILKECSEGLHFGPSYFGCVKPELAGCESTTIGIVTDIDTTTKLIPTDCPPDNSGQPVRLPHETNCSLFYECDDGKKILHQCQDDFHFNAQLQMCEWSDSAGCITRTTDMMSSEGTTKPTKPADGTSMSVPTECSLDNAGKSVQLPHPYNCSLYYTCANGNKVIQVCPDRLEFNAKKQVCDWPPVAGCVTSTTKEPWTTWIWSTSSSIAQDRSTETLKTSTDKLTTLPSSPVEKLTTPPNSTTKKWIKTTKAEGGTSVPMPNECPSDNSGYAVQLPHPYNCSLFYKCDDGNKVVQSCPEGLEFNAREQICDWPIIAACVTSTTKEPWTKWIWSTTSGTSQDRSTETSETSEDLKNPSSSTIEKLTLPSRVTTEKLTTLPSSITEKLTTLPNFNTEKLTTLPSVTTDKLPIPPSSTTKKLTTVPKSTIEEFSIPPSSTTETRTIPLSSTSGKLITPQSSTTEKGIMPPNSTTEKGITTDISITIPICESDSKLSHENNCSLYYECDEGTKKLKECPPGLHFNPLLNICDWPANVGCARTTIQWTHSPTEQPSPPKPITTEPSRTPTPTTKEQPSPSEPITTEQPSPSMTTKTEQPSPPTTTMSEQPSPPTTTMSEQGSTPKPITTEKPRPPTTTTFEQTTTPKPITTEQSSPPSSTTAKQPSTSKPITTEKPSPPTAITTGQPSPPKPITTEQPSPSMTTMSEQPSTPKPVMSEQPSPPTTITSEQPSTPKPITTEQPNTPKPITTEQPRPPMTTMSEQPRPPKPITTEQSSSPSSITAKQMSTSKPITTEQPSPPTAITTGQPSPPKPITTEQPSPSMTTMSEQPSTPKPVMSEQPSTPKPVMSEQPSPPSTITSEQPSTPKPITSEQPSTPKPITTEQPSTPKPITTEQPRPPMTTMSEQPRPPKPITTEQSSSPSSITAKQMSTSKPITTEQPSPPTAITTGQPSPPTPITTEQPSMSMTTLSEPPSTPKPVMGEQPSPPATITSEQPSTPKPITTEQPRPPMTTMSEQPRPPKPITTEPSNSPSSTMMEQPSSSKPITTEQPSPPKPITTEQPGSPTTITSEQPSTPKPITAGQPRPPNPITTEQPSPPKPITTEQPSPPMTIMSQQPSTPKPITTEEPTTDYDWSLPDTCIGTCPQGDPMNAILLPNIDCTKFCICSNGGGYVYDCPKKLHFSPSKRLCDYPRRAKCVGKGGFGHAKV